MRAFLALVFRDLTLLPRKKFFYCKRVMFLVIFFIILYTHFTDSPLRNNTTLGRETFITFSVLAFVLTVLFAPGTAALSLIKERESRNLDFLLLTNLSYRGIIFAKFFSQFMNLFLIGLSALPLLLMCVNFGGISGEQILAGCGVLVSFLFLALSLGLFTATFTSSKNAFGASFFLTIFYLLLGFAFEWLYSFNITFTNIITVFYPPISLQAAMAGKNLNLAFMNTGINIFIGILFMLWAAYILSFTNQSVSDKIKFSLKKIFQKKATPSLSSKPQESNFISSKPQQSNFVSPSKKVKGNSGEIEGNPVAWRDYNKMYGGHKRSIIKFICCFVLFLLIIFSNTAPRPATSEFPLITSFIIMMFFFTFSVFSYAIRAFVREKEKNTLDILLSTGLSNKEIVNGKLLGIFHASRVYLLVSLFPLILLCLSWVRKEINFGYILGFTFYGIALICVITMLALYISLRVSSTNKAIFCAILIMILWFWISNIIFYSILSSLTIHYCYHPFYETEFISLTFIWSCGYALITFLLWKATVNKVR